MAVQAVIVVLSSGLAKEFKPTGVTDEWELELMTHRGPEPGGHWSSMEVAESVVTDIYES